MIARAIGTTIAEARLRALEVLELAAPLDRRSRSAASPASATCARASSTHETRSRPRRLTSTRTVRVSASRRTCVGPFGLVDLRDLGERHASRRSPPRRRARRAPPAVSVRGRHERAAGRSGAGPRRSTPTVHADARGLDGRERVLRRDAVAGEAHAIGPHDDGGRAEHALDAHVARAAHVAHERADLLADPLQLARARRRRPRSARRRASR